LVALAAVLAVGQLLGRVFSRIGQPAVLGEIVAGILLGPSVLGRIAPAVSDAVLPVSVAPALGHVAQLGAVLYMFLVGVELEFGTLRTRARATGLIAVVGILVPFALGVALAYGLHPYGAGVAGARTSYALFVGVVMSVTAFPVLARILADGGLQQTDLGRLALTAAAADDVAAWGLLALVIGVAHADVGRAVAALALTLVFVVLMVTLVRPILVRAAQPARGGVSSTTFAATVLAILVSAAITEALGVHAIFGAFLLGVLVPADSPLARTLIARFEHVVTIVLLPAFFAVTGLRMQIGVLGNLTEWGALALVVLVGSVGKVGATALASRSLGFDWRTALGLGALMNTRGLMQIIVLNIGLELGLFSSTLFTVLALAALVSTMATAPALHALGVWSPSKKRIGITSGAA
jgi:Kef-type K+ transport system membrane component KefB